MPSFDTVTRLAADLPAVELSTSYGTPALKVKGKLMARLKEDGETLVLRVDWDERERLLAIHPDVFFMTDHYRSGPWVLMRLGVARPAQLKAGLAHAWRQSAPPRLLAQLKPNEEIAP